MKERGKRENKLGKIERYSREEEERINKKKSKEGNRQVREENRENEKRKDKTRGETNIRRHIEK